MDWLSLLSRRPILVAVAGSNGAGKSTFHHAHLSDCGLRFVNADDLAAALGLDPCEAADLAAAIRRERVAQRESFVFETVLSDPRGAKIAGLEALAEDGIQVALVFIRIESSEVSKQRVSMRVAQGGHDVPDEKLEARFDRTLANLERAIRSLPLVNVFDDSDLASPCRLESVYADGARGLP